MRANLFFCCVHWFRRVRSTRLLLWIVVTAILLPQFGFSQQSAIKPFTLVQIEELVSNGVPDSTMSTQIKLHRLAFTPTEADLDELRAKGAGPLTLAAIRESQSSPPPPHPHLKPTITVSAQPTSVSPGQSATLTWNSTSATRVTLNGKAVSLGGSLAESPSATTTYLFKALNGQGMTSTASVTVTVVPQITPTISLQANPLSIAQGQTVTLSWQSSNATSVLINGVSVPVSGTQIVHPVQSTTYQAIAKSTSGETASASAMIEVRITSEQNKQFSGTVPFGTPIRIRIINNIDSAKVSAGSVFHAVLAQNLLVENHEVVPANAEVDGRIVEARKGNMFGRPSELKLELTEIYVNSQPTPITTNQFDSSTPAGGNGTATITNGEMAIDQTHYTASQSGVNIVNGAINEVNSIAQNIMKKKSVVINANAILQFTLEKQISVKLP